MAKKTMSVVELLNARHGLTDGDSVRYGGPHNAWRLVREEYSVSFGHPYSLWHDGALMLVWSDQETWGTDGPAVSVDVGHGSRSDQVGMNKVFRHLDIPWRYDRHGGVARIVDITDGEELPLLAYFDLLGG